MARVWCKSGSEGPRHDPYSWDETYFEKTDGTLVMLRQGGLGYSRLYVDGKLVTESFGDSDAAEAQFEAHTGVSVWVAKELPHRLQERRLLRLSPAQREAELACHEADMRMLAYAM